MSVLRVEALDKDFGGLSVLKGVSFAVETGERLALIGPNGAGKTTLLNAIGGQISVSNGDVFLGKKRITDLTPHKRLHLGLGRSYQINNLFFDCSVLDNVLLALYGAGRRHSHAFGRLEKRQGLAERAEMLLETVGLWDERHEPIHTLSYGDQRLVELMFAFASKPQLVLLDEPSAGLPTAEAAALADVVRKLAEETTLLFCAHDMDLVFNLADAIMVLYFGEVIAKGTPEEVAADPVVREIYLGGDETC